MRIQICDFVDGDHQALFERYRINAHKCLINVQRIQEMIGSCSIVGVDSVDIVELSAEREQRNEWYGRQAHGDIKAVRNHNYMGKLPALFQLVSNKTAKVISAEEDDVFILDILCTKCRDFQLFLRTRDRTAKLQCCLFG